MFTRVLMGHIDLAQCIFPLGTSGNTLDCLARKYLWEINCDYAHGMCVMLLYDL
jgi:Xaa-Pro aminopeptidase